MCKDFALWPVQDSDLNIFFEQQNDPKAVQMAAFTAKDPADRAAFDNHWDKIRADPHVLPRAIVCDNEIAGNIVSHRWSGELEISYWLGRAYWGRGIATRALNAFLREQSERPIFARVASDNLASLRVLEKCGFTLVDRDESFANARGAIIAETILRLDGPPISG